MMDKVESELQALRARISQYEAWFRAINANSNFDFWFKNAQSQYTYVNPHFAKNMGRDICNLQNVRPEDIFDGDRLERVKTLDKQVMDDGYLKRVIPCDASGTLQMHEEHRFAVTDKAGEPIGLGCFAFEITEKSLAEETLHQAEKIANLCSWRWSADTNLLVSCSDQMASFLGVSMTETFEVFPKRAQSLVLPEDRHVFKAVEDRMNGLSKDGYEIEYRIRRADGHVVHVRETAEPFSMSENVEEYLGVMRDITREKLAEAALKKSNENLEHEVQRRTVELKYAKDKAETANNSKTQFLATMSHELRTPMNGVLGMTQILQETSLNADQMNLIDIIHNSGSALVTILNDILDFSKIEAGLMELDPQPFNLREAVKDVVDLLSHAADEKGLDLQVQIHLNVPKLIIGDVGRVRQVLMNLVGNAIKFTSSGYVNIVIDSKIVGEHANLSIKVIDSGAGIAADKLGVIFDEFTQAEQSTTRKYGGTGLGLSITRSIVEAMPNGEISVKSELNKGSTFTVKLSLGLVASDRHNSSDRPNSDVLDTPNFGNETILVVTADKKPDALLVKTLKDWGLKPVSSKGAKQALSVLKYASAKGAKIDAVIIENDLGRYKGSQLVQAIEKTDSIADMKTIVFATGDATEDLKRSIFDCLEYSVSAKNEASSISPETYAAAENSDVPSEMLRRSILVVDDNQTNLDVMTYMLGTDKYDVDRASNGKVACEMAEIKPYDLIFMDISMPVMGGVEATQTIRKFNRSKGFSNMPIIAVTAHAMSGDHIGFLDQGMTDYIAKPVNRTDIHAIVQKYLSAPNSSEKNLKRLAGVAS